MDDASLEIVDTIKKYYGLSLFNLRKYSRAADVSIAFIKKITKKIYTCIL